MSQRISSGGATLPTRGLPPHRHLLGLEGVGRETILRILDAAEAMILTRAPEAQSTSLCGRTVVNLFFEASTRTRTSFELAAKRLGADAVNVAAASSSVSKGETLLDTVRNLDAMRCDLLVLRHPASGAPQLVADDLDARGASCAVVNAGDGLHEHPTQALLDAFTIRRERRDRRGWHKRHDQREQREKHGTDVQVRRAPAAAGDDFRGMVVTIAGDILHSRVARSNVLLLTTLGATVRLVGPRTLLPKHAEALRAPDVPGALEVYDRLEPALEGADVVMMLRVQRERLLGGFLSTSREYARTFGLSVARLARAKPDAIVLHPGPMNRGVEIDDDVASGPQAVILGQVEAGVAVRMAVLHLLAPEPPARRATPGR